MGRKPRNPLLPTNRDVATHCRNALVTCTRRLQEPDRLIHVSVWHEAFTEEIEQWLSEGHLTRPEVVAVLATTLYQQQKKLMEEEIDR